jgi:excisionase family DNA binding protein
MPTEIGNLILYTTKEVAEKLEVTPLTLRKYINQGRIKGQKVGQRFFISQDNLNEFFNNYSKK